MSQSAVRVCRIVAPERLSDRFLTSGLLRQQQDSWDVANQVVVLYLLEITRPWFPSSNVFSAVQETLEQYLPELHPGEQLADQFEGVLRKVNRKLADLSDEGETDWIGNLNGMLAVIGGDEIHFSQTGSVPAYLLQANRIRQITDDPQHESEPHPMRTFANLSSGTLQADDRILFGTHELYRELSLDALRRIVSRQTPYQASQSIVRELKREKNPGVTSWIIAFEIPETPQEEPTDVSLEEALRTPLQKTKHALIPVVQKVAETSRKAAAAAQVAASKTNQYVQEKALPATERVVRAGGAKASELLSRAEHLQKDASMPDGAGIAEVSDAAELPAEIPVVRRIYPRKRGLAAVAEKTKGAQQSASAQKILTTIQRAPIVALAALLNGIGWIRQHPLRRRLALGAMAVLCLGVVGLAILVKRRPVAITPAQSQNTAVIDRLRVLNADLETASSSDTTIDLAALATEANQQYDQLNQPSEGQQREADRVWMSITERLDTLTKTTRLTSAAASYKLPATGKQLLVGLPFFYSTPTSTSNVLLRTGKGDAGTTQRSITVAPDENPVALARSLETDTVGYVFTNQRRVFRLTQEQADTSLRQVILEGGETFASGDMLGTYRGNLYIVDSVNGLLWRYATTGTAYSKGTSVIDKTKYDLKKTVSFAIDGSIYLLKPDGTVQKFVSGRLDGGFALNGIPTANAKLLQPTQITTNEQSDNLYVLDAGLTSSERPTARVLQFTKDGAFVRQFAFPKDTGAIRSIDVSEQDKTMWVVANDQVLEYKLP